MAKKFWRPRAGAIPHIVTVTFGGTPATTDTVTISINDSPLTVTIGTLTDTTNVADAMAAAWDAINTTAGIQDETRNIGGRQYPEHLGITARAESDTVILTANTPGMPFTVVASKTGAVTISAATTQAATGPNELGDAANYSGGTFPVSGDQLIFDQGSVGPMHGLDYFRTNTIDISVLVTGDFLAGIGLPWWNAAGYQEYRPRFMQLYDTAGARSIDIRPGNNGGAGTNTLRFDLQSQTWDEIRVNASIGNSPRLEVHGGSVDLFSVASGWASIDPDDAEQAAGMTVDKVLVGMLDNSQQNPRVSIGRNTAWNASDTPVDVLGGLLELHNVLDQGTPESKPLTILGGVVRAVSDGDIEDVTVEGGTFDWVGVGTSNGTIEVWEDATLDLSHDGRAKSFGTVNAYRGANVKLGNQTPTITPIGCKLEDINIIR